MEGMKAIPHSERKHALLNASSSKRWMSCTPSGKFPGYDKNEKGQLVINEEEDQVVRRIYSEFLNGYGCFQIAEKLNKEKSITACGSKFSSSSILKVLTNEKLKSDTLCQKTYNRDHITKKRIKNNKSELPQFYFENTHSAIIDKSTWEYVQLEMKRQDVFVLEHKLNKYHQHSERLPFSG